MLGSPLTVLPLDNTFLSPQLQRIFERVRQSADFMPPSQMTVSCWHFYLAGLESASVVGIIGVLCSALS